MGAICGTTDTVVLTLAIKSIKAQPFRISCTYHKIDSILFYYNTPYNNSKGPLSTQRRPPCNNLVKKMEKAAASVIIVLSTFKAIEKDRYRESSVIIFYCVISLD